MKKRILTGIRPTGRLHIGHYFGAGKSWVLLQDHFNTFIEIADVQGLTDNFDNPEKVSINTREVAIDLLAIGINPETTTIFIQSMIPEIAELTVFYSNLVTLARLYRNPTVKHEMTEKKKLFGNDGESLTYGFIGYPVSQAADITAFKGDLVPVGEDQLPLIEQCREIVRKFNTIYGDTLVEPEAYLSENKRIKGLDGNDKMGKSLGNAIFLRDSEEEVTNKIMKAYTNPDKIKKDDPADPENCMVYYYHKLIESDNLKTIEEECRLGKRGCVNCKKELAKNMNEFLKLIREKGKYYEEHPEIVDNILKEGTKRAKKEAEETMKELKKAIKIDYFN